MTAQQRMYFLTPTYSPLGGVVKIFDYVNHAISLGFHVVICCAQPFSPDLPLFRIGRFRGIAQSAGVDYISPENIALDENDLVFFSSVKDYKFLKPHLTTEDSYARIIHIIQNVRHANPAFHDGGAIRLLALPFSRIVINDEVMDAINPYLNKHSYTTVVPLGHDTWFFRKQRGKGFHMPMRVAYTTWKSRIGDIVRDQLRGEGDNYRFKCIREHVSWNELRGLYHWADVFLSAPGEEEGFYLPGLEAMAAGAIVLIPDVGGNRAYCKFGDNCIYVEFEDAGSYISALHDLRMADRTAIGSMRRKAYLTVNNHLLPNEKNKFSLFIEQINTHVRA